MFERFTQQARGVVIGAQLEARRLRHGGIGTSHLLLAVLDGGSSASALLQLRGVTHEAADRALAQILAARTSSPGSPSATPPSTTPSEESSAGAPARDEPRGPDQRAQDAEALAALGIDLDRIQDAVEAAFGPGALDRGRRSAQPRGLRRFGRSRATRPDLHNEFTMLRGTRSGGGHLPFGDDAKRALELSLREAIRLRDGQIGVEHLVLGLLRGDDTVAAGILARLHVDRSELRQAVEHRVRRSTA